MGFDWLHPQQSLRANDGDWGPTAGPPWYFRAVSFRRRTLVIPAGLVLGLGACGDSDPANLVRKSIGPSGGLISSHDGVLSIALLPGALSSEVDVEIFPSDEPPPIFGLVYRVRPDIDLMFGAEITYRRVLPGNPNAGVIGAIKLDNYSQEMGHWEPLERLAVNADQQAVIAVDDQLSLYYGLVEAPGAPPLPSDGDTTVPTDDDGTTGGATSGATDPDPMTDGTTMAVDPTTDGGPGETSNASMESGPPMTDEGPGSTDDGMMVEPICSDGMIQPGVLCLVEGMTFATGLQPIDVKLGEFDAAAGLDAVTLDVGALEVGLLSGNDDGTFAAPVTAGVVAGTPSEFLMGDFSGDGPLDLVTLDTAADSLGLLTGDGAGLFAASIDTAVNMGAVDLASAEFNGDAALDLAVLGADGPDLQFWFGGPGGFAPGAATAVNAGLDLVVAAGDFNPSFDTNDDGMAVGAGGYQAWASNAGGTMFIGNVVGGFGAGGTFVEIAVGDINDDGVADLAAVDSVGGAVIVGLATGAPAAYNFGPPFAVGGMPSDIALADLDADGDLEAIVSNFGTDNVTILSWDDGTLYTTEFTFDVGAGPSGVAVGELNGDGLPDIVVSAQNSDELTVLLSDP